MEFLRFEDFRLNEQSKFVTFEAVNEAALTGAPDKKVKFGICITTYKIDSGGRQNHMTTEKVLESLPDGRRISKRRMARDRKISRIYYSKRQTLDGQLEHSW